MRPERGQRVAAAWAVRGQPYPAVGAELPVAFDLTAAITALLHELVKLLLELQERGLPRRSSDGGWWCSSSMVFPPFHIVSRRLSLSEEKPTYYAT
jgi:hypothetical protein